jgi:multiple sugar transport system permease protein
MFKRGVWLRYLAGAGAALLFVLPLYWGVVASLQPTEAPPAVTIAWWPSDPAWENYKRIFEIVPLARHTKNSLIVTAVAIPVTTLIASLAGFGLSQINDERQSGQIIQFSVIALMIPGAAVWIFRFLIIKWLGLFDTLGALMLPAFAATTPLFVLLFYWGFRHIPQEMFEAARLDGASPFTLWWKLAVPLSRPTIAGVVALAFVFYWSDFIAPVIYIFNTQQYTLPIGIEMIKQMDATNTPILMAASVFMAAPVILLFWILQRFFLHDLALANLFDKS